MSYPPDPADVFASDVHRRVMANVPNPDEQPLSVDDLLEVRVARDDHLRDAGLGADDLLEVLKDLEADGHVRESKGGWRNTADGWEALTNEKANAEGDA